MIIKINITKQKMRGRNMLTREQSVENFKSCITDIVSSNYILVTKKITALLKCISNSKLFFELVEHCVGGFDYYKNKSQYFSESGVFVKPKTAREIIAFTFLLLYEVDAQKTDLTKIINEYFYEGDTNDSFKRFCRELLLPFCDEMLITAMKMMDESEQISGDVLYSRPISSLNGEAPPVSVTRVEKSALSDEDAQRIKTIMTESKTVILQSKMDSLLKTDLMTLYDNFFQQLFGTDFDRLKLAFLGYKYCALFHKKLDLSVNKIEDILKNSGI